MQEPCAIFIIIILIIKTGLINSVDPQGVAYTHVVKYCLQGHPVDAENYAAQGVVSFKKLTWQAM